MSEFSQNGIISTLHDFGTRSTNEIEKDLLKFSKERKMELILPCLYSELEGSALPSIVEEISKTKYLDHIIVGLDRANEAQAKKAWKFFKKLKSPFSILWNDGPLQLSLYFLQITQLLFLLCANQIEVHSYQHRFCRYLSSQVQIYSKLL